MSEMETKNVLHLIKKENLDDNNTSSCSKTFDSEPESKRIKLELPDDLGIPSHVYQVDSIAFDVSEPKTEPDDFDYYGNYAKGKPDIQFQTKNEEDVSYEYYDNVVIEENKSVTGGFNDRTGSYLLVLSYGLF